MKRIRAIRVIRGQSAWVAGSEWYERKVRSVLLPDEILLQQSHVEAPMSSIQKGLKRLR